MTTPDDLPRATPLLGVAWKVVAGLAALGALILAIGFALPATWEATAKVHVDAPPDSVFDRIDDPSRWDTWTAMGGVETTLEGPARGVGAGRAWDDSFVGRGRFVITESDRPRRVAYRVEVDGGSLTTRGALELKPDAGGTLVTWTESGDFGRNPLMGFAAISMDRVQRTELRRGLTRLRILLEGGAVPDSLTVS